MACAWPPISRMAYQEDDGVEPAASEAAVELTSSTSQVMYLSRKNKPKS